ncbi:hypothetical protein [uncultured Litoreibacter sp.]|uniref:DUF1127 domain-containing protein n=1 Tax=uncultured Litoreibacter sp. TaxID=1392394 RepID=UPI002623E151|nr:hypothetical protein [uncultured Litoreibacter sp.]
MTFISQTAPLDLTGMTETFSRLIQAPASMVRTFFDRRVMKASLEQLSDKHVRDIGLTRNEISSIAHTPLPSHGALELSCICKSRAGSW